MSQSRLPNEADPEKANSTNLAQSFLSKLDAFLKTSTSSTTTITTVVTKNNSGTQNSFNKNNSSSSKINLYEDKPPELLKLRPAKSTTNYILSALKPPKTRPESMFDMKTKVILEKKTFHPMYKVKRADTSKKENWYYVKENTKGSLMSQIEAMLCDFYRVLAYDYVPSMHAHYNDKGEMTSVSSIEMPYDSLAQNPITWKDIKNPEFKKGLAKTLAASYLFEEDDLHRGNLSKSGHRIDFDMSLWSLLYKFKDRGLIDMAFRDPKEKQFIITARDIREFPHLQDAKPFYWPTSEAPFIPESVRVTISKVWNSSQNAYTSKDNEIFKSLKDEPDFRYYFYQTLTQFMITTDLLYRNISKMHLDENIQLDDKNLISSVSDKLKNRMLELKNVLVNMPEYEEFITNDGKRAYDEIVQEFSEHNARMKNKITTEKLDEKLDQKSFYLDTIINLDDAKNSYRDICKAIVERPTEPENNQTSSTFQKVKV